MLAQLRPQLQAHLRNTMIDPAKDARTLQQIEDLNRSVTLCKCRRSSCQVCSAAGRDGRQRIGGTRWQEGIERKEGCRAVPANGRKELLATTPETRPHRPASVRLLERAARVGHD